MIEIRPFKGLGHADHGWLDARHHFSFADYRRRLLAHPLFKQLNIRTWLARYAYLLNYPIVVRVGWSLMRLFLRFTPWKNRDYVPARLPVLKS